jgi:hypothetical protein
MRPERRKDYELRQIVDEYRRMGREANENAAKARDARTRAEFTAIAESWNALAEDLAGRAMPRRSA